MTVTRKEQGGGGRGVSVVGAKGARGKEGGLWVSFRNEKKKDDDDDDD